MGTEEEFLRRIRAANQALDLTEIHLSPEEKKLLVQLDNKLDKRQADLEEKFGRELVPEEENELVQQTFKDLPGSREAFDKRDSLIVTLEKKLGHKRG